MEKYRLDIREEGVYELEPGTYSIDPGAEALAEGEDVEIVEGAGEYKPKKLILTETCQVWIPSGSTLWPWSKTTVKTVPFGLKVSPLSGTGETRFACTISGAKSTRKVQIRLDKPLALDPVVNELTGNGTVYLKGDTIAARMEGIFEKRIPAIREKTKRIGIYGREKSWGIDRKTPKVYVTVKYGGIIEAIPTIPGVPTPKPPTPVAPEEVEKGIAAGKTYYIKCTLPLLSMLPGLPYIKGLPILPGFVISETA